MVDVPVPRSRISEVLLALYLLVNESDLGLERETGLEPATSTLASLPPNVIVFPDRKQYKGGTG